MDRRRILLVVAVLVAAMGAGLVFFYAQNAEDRAADDLETVGVLVVTTQIERGESANEAYAAGKVTEQQVPAAQLLDGATADGEPFRDRVALTTLYPGEQLLPVKFGGADEVEGEVTLPIPDGKVAISVSLSDTARVGSFTRPGARVAILVTGTLPPDNVPATRLLLNDILVLATGSTTQMVAQTDETGAPVEAEALPNTLLTLAVSQEQAQKVLFAQTNGELAFALLGDNSNVTAGSPVDLDNLFDE